VKLSIALEDPPSGVMKEVSNTPISAMSRAGRLPITNNPPLADKARFDILNLRRSCPGSLRFRDS